MDSYVPQQWKTMDVAELTFGSDEIIFMSLQLREAGKLRVGVAYKLAFTYECFFFFFERNTENICINMFIYVYNRQYQNVYIM